MAMAEPVAVSRQVEDEEEEMVQAFAETGGAEISAAPPSAAQAGDPVSGLGVGRPLPAHTRAFFEPRFGRNFSEVRVHDGAAAQARARAFGAQAFAYGRDIVFGPGRYDPDSREGRRLLAHELVHVVQQDRASPTARAVSRTGSNCPEDWETTVADDRTEALAMMDRAIAALKAYDGTNPANVATAMQRHFGTSSSTAAWIVSNHTRSVRLLAPMAGYQCANNGDGNCGDTTLAWAFWCVPGVDVRVCAPHYFKFGDTTRSTTLIHEWFHKYDCSLDLGYEGTEDYPSSFLGALANADNFAELIRDIS